MRGVYLKASMQRRTQEANAIRPPKPIRYTECITKTQTNTAPVSDLKRIAEVLESIEKHLAKILAQ